MRRPLDTARPVVARLLAVRPRRARLGWTGLGTAFLVLSGPGLPTVPAGAAETGAPAASPLGRPGPPRLTAAFRPTSTVTGTPADLVLTVSRSRIGLTESVRVPVNIGFGYRVALPSGLTVAGTASSTCGGSLTAEDGTATVTQPAGTVGLNTCTVTVPVAAGTAGVYTLTDNDITDLVGITYGAPIAECLAAVQESNCQPPPVLTVTGAMVPGPALTAGFAPGTVPPGHPVTLSLDLARSATGMAATGLGYTVSLPAGLTISGTPSNACGGTVTALVGTRSIALSTGVLHTGHPTCGLAVAVTPADPGAYPLPDTAVTNLVHVTNQLPHAGITLTATTPTPPVVGSVTATAGVSSITAAWSIPTGNGTTITGYTAYAAPGPAFCETTGTSCVLGGTAGTPYQVKVVAHAAGGDNSADSPLSTEVTPTAPVVTGAPPLTDLTLTTDRPTVPGQKVTVLGTGFVAYSTVMIAIYSTPTVLGTVVTDANGNFSKRVTVPPGLTPGGHTFIAFGVDPRGAVHNLRLGVTVGELARTGTASSAVLLLGAVLVAIGAVLRLSWASITST